MPATRVNSSPDSDLRCPFSRRPHPTPPPRTHRNVAPTSSDPPFSLCTPAACLLSLAVAAGEMKSPDMPPVETGSAGGSAIEHGGMGGGGGEGVEMTPTGYEPPLELPDGCHHISLEKFLEVTKWFGFLRLRQTVQYLGG